MAQLLVVPKTVFSVCWSWKQLWISRPGSRLLRNVFSIPQSLHVSPNTLPPPPPPARYVHTSPQSCSEEISLSSEVGGRYIATVNFLFIAPVKIISRNNIKLILYDRRGEAGGIIRKFTVYVNVG